MLRCDHQGGADQGWANSVHNPVCDRLLWNRPRCNLPRCQHQVPPPKVRSISICQFSSSNFNSIHVLPPRVRHIEYDIFKSSLNSCVWNVFYLIQSNHYCPLSHIFSLCQVEKSRSEIDCSKAAKSLTSGLSKSTFLTMTKAKEASFYLREWLSLELPAL